MPMHLFVTLCDCNVFSAVLQVVLDVVAKDVPEADAERLHEHVFKVIFLIVQHLLQAACQGLLTEHRRLPLNYGGVTERHQVTRDRTECKRMCWSLK